MFKLVIQDDEGKTTVVPLIRDEITIGRKEGNTIRLTERNVSRRHARIMRNNGEVQIEDLNSYNGIRVNNARIAERVSLRVSDQVQIGDYKLYLKAEGVEQVDDARTMPIERIESGSPTDVLPVVTVTTAPTAPMAAPAAPAPTPPPVATPAAAMAAAAAAPNRSQIAVADTDPSGRPIATAAQVAALTQPVGYGRLVIVSSNYAGKEFDLTRPQMIVGRTGENDIVIDHRSISRNHAKITREPESGRYSISDLQSANGVRVNGRDFTKVELRRGDTVDLGHVRLRFIEPGEDFVFARDAQITDVPNTGGKGGLRIAVVLGVLVLGAGGAYVAFGRKAATPVAGGAGSGSGSASANTGEDRVVGSDTTPTNGSGGGSDVAVGSAGSAVVAPPDPVVTGSGTATRDADAVAQLRIECEQLAVDKKWPEAISCSDRVSKLDADAGRALKKVYQSEVANEQTFAGLKDAIRAQKFTQAKDELAKIEESSVYWKDADTQFNEFVAEQERRFKGEAEGLAAKNSCAALERLASEARAKGGDAAAAAVASVQCEKAVATPVKPVEVKDCTTKLHNNTASCRNTFCKANPGASQCTTGQVQVAAPANCDADKLKDTGQQQQGAGQHAAALASYESALRCREDQTTRRLAVMAACNAGSAGKAKNHFAKLSAAMQGPLRGICLRNKIVLE